MDISEKSGYGTVSTCALDSPNKRRVLLTLRVEEVADRHWMSASIGVDGGVFEHLILMLLRPNTHVLLT